MTNTGPAGSTIRINAGGPFGRCDTAVARTPSPEHRFLIDAPAQHTAVVNDSVCLTGTRSNREEKYMNYTTPAVTKTALSGALDEEKCWGGSMYACN